MSHPIYYVPAGDVLPIFFSSFDGGTGASITMTGLAVTDIEIYKDGSVTQRASDNGYTLLDTDGIDFDGITGIHGFSIDTGDNSDASFYTVGAWFTVVVSAITIDAQTVNFIAAQFRLMAAESVAAKPKVDVDVWLGTAAATPTVAGVPEVDLTHIAGSAVSTSTAQLGVNAVQAGGTAWGSGAITAASIANAAIDAATFAADVDAEILSYLVDDATRIDASSLNTATVTTIPAILTDTAEIGVAGAGLTEAGGTGDQLTAVPWNAAWDAEVQSEANDALVANNLDHLVLSAVDTNFATTVHLDSVIGHLVDAGTTATFDRTTDALEVIGQTTADTLTDTAEIGAAGAGLTNINLPDQTMNVTGNITGNLSGSVGSVTGAVGSVTAGVTVTTNNDKTDYALSATGSASLTEGYAADGAAPTLNQMLYQIWSALSEFSISGTTITCKQLDGTTTSMTFTLDDGTNPTSRTRAT